MRCCSVHTRLLPTAVGALLIVGPLFRDFILLPRPLTSVVAALNQGSYLRMERFGGRAGGQLYPRSIAST